MNFYDVLAAEKWGGGISTMNFFDLLFAQSVGGGKNWQVYEGTLPATINANGADMKQYQIYGADGGVGEPTENLINVFATDSTNGFINNAMLLSNGKIYTPSYNFVSEYFPISENTVYTYFTGGRLGGSQSVCFYDDNKAYISGVTLNSATTISFKTPPNTRYIRVTVMRSSSDLESYKKATLTLGDTAPTFFIPYGYKLDMAIGGNILQSSEIEWGGWQAAGETIPSKIVNPARCRSKNMYSISGEKIFYDFKSLNVNIAFVNSNERSLGGTGFKTGVGSVDVPANAVKCLFIIANTDTNAGITPTQVIAAGIWASVDATITPIYIGNNLLDNNEYIDYQAGKVYRMIDSTLTPTDPPVPLPALPTLEGETVVDYAGESVAQPEKVVLEYAKGGN